MIKSTVGSPGNDQGLDNNDTKLLVRFQVSVDVVSILPLAWGSPLKQSYQLNNVVLEVSWYNLHDTANSYKMYNVVCIGA